MHFFLLDRYWVDEPLHSIFEALGSFTALSLAILILILQKDKRIPSYYMWVSCALIGMGILDGFHAFSPPGDPFVWLHGMAVLVGGFLFAMVWLPDRVAQSRPTSALHIVVAVVTVILSVFVVYSPDILPAMINEGVFTSVADTINTLGGLFFLSAAVYFVIRYRSDNSHEDFLFVNFCLLNGWAGLLFPFSQIWHPDWWFWHVLRLAAYLTVLSYMFITFQRSEETLRKEKDKARKYLDIAGVMIVVIDPDQKVTLANKRCCEILGYREDEIIGRNWFNIFLPEGIRSEVKATFAKLMTGEIAPVEFFENPILTKSGEKRLIAWHNTVLRDKAGNIICTLSSGEDITERKLAEEELLERERSYRTLSENLPGIVYRVFLKENNRMQFFNNTVQPMTGFTAEELMAGDVCSLDPLIISEDRAHVITTVKRAIMDNQPFQIEYRLKHKEGAIRYFLERGRPINGADGNPLYIDGVIFDITESKRAEEQIREQAELLDKAQDAISLWDLEHRLIYWNKGAVRLYGWTAKETIGKNADEFLYKEESPQFIEAKKSVIEKGEWSGELRHVTKDGKEIIVESRWTLVRDSKGEPKSILVSRQ